MVTDRRPVAGQAVQPSLDLRLRRRRGGRPAERAEVGGGADRVDQGPRRHAYAGQAALGADGEGVRERGLQVPAVLLGDVELTGDVGLRGAELARVPEQAPQGVGGAQHDQGRVRGPGDRAVPRLQPDRQVAADEGPYGLGEPVRDPGRRERLTGCGLGHWCSLVKVSCETLM